MPRVKKNPYVADIKIFGKFYRGVGPTLLEALMDIKPLGRASGMSILTVAHGDASREKILNSFQTSRLFNPSPTMRTVAMKNMQLIFGSL